MKKLYGVLKGLSAAPRVGPPRVDREEDALLDAGPRYNVRWFETRAEAEAYVAKAKAGFIVGLEGGLVKPPPPEPRWEEAE